MKPDIGVVELVDTYVQPYDAAWIRDACRLFARVMLEPDLTVGMSLTGSLTPAGLGGSCVAPLIQAWFVDWIVSSGANLHQDTHFAQGNLSIGEDPFWTIESSGNSGWSGSMISCSSTRVLLRTDEFFQQVIRNEEFQAESGTAELHFRPGEYIAAACRAGVPVYTLPGGQFHRSEYRVSGAVRMPNSD